MSTLLAMTILFGQNAVTPVAGAGDSAGPWDRVLQSYVVDGGVDYASLAANRADLDAFLAEIRVAEPPSDPGRSAAFWINAYNAAVLSLVVERYPLASVMDVDGFFDDLRTEVAGELLTLDEIEQRALGSGDPRIHFAVVCAAQSCPPLLGEPFEAAELETQLEGQTRTFLADESKGARLDEAAGVLWLSSLFKWYGDDFTSGSRVMAYLRRSRLVDWVRPYLPESAARAVERAEPSVRYIDYDWTLNDRPSAGEASTEGTQSRGTRTEKASESPSVWLPTDAPQTEHR